MHMIWTVQTMCTPNETMTVRRLAELCHVSKSTVGMALQSDPRVALKTRERIKAMAGKHDYKGDPRISHLMSLLNKGHRQAVWNVAWLNSSDSIHAWTERPWLAGYLKGVQRRARELGFGLDPVWIQNQSPAQLAKVLKARGVQGLLVPFPEETNFWQDFPWDQFSAVVVDDFDIRISLPHVMSDRHGNMRIVLDELKSLGYVRPALWLQARLDNVRDAYSSAYLGWHHKQGLQAPLLWSFDQLSVDTVRRKLEAEKPDVIVCCHNGMLEHLESAGFSVPDALSVVHLNLAADVPNWSGIDQRHENVGASALDALNTLLMKGETGLSAASPAVSLPGIWRTGKTTTDQAFLTESVHLQPAGY